MSSFFRLFGFLALLIAFIIVKITVKPAIEWLNLLLLLLSLGSLMSGIFNLAMCGMPATGLIEMSMNKRMLSHGGRCRRTMF